MGERSEHAPGTFSWAELATTDADAAKAFYGALLGWEPEDHPIPGGGGTYTFLRRGGLSVAALHGHVRDGATPSWTSYVTVADADATAQEAAGLGGEVLAGPFDVGSSGRTAAIRDSQGAVFAVWQPREHIGARLVNDPGAMTLNQLNAASPDAAREFYAGLFGWRFEQVEGQAYWGIYNGERLNGGMLPLPDGAPVPTHWLVYFTSADLDGDATRIADLGGRVVVAPMEIPSGRILLAADPQGAHFALFEGEVDD